MAYPKDDKALKRWEDGVTASVKAVPASWNSYDSTIKSVIADYTKNLSSIAGYSEPDWKIVKSILWTETGAAIPDWNTAPMQIGVNGDPGLKELLTSQAGKIILPANYQTTLTTTNVPTSGTYNVMAGVGYMLKILAKFGYYYPLTPPPPLVPVADPNASATSTPPPPLLPQVSPQPLTTAHAPAKTKAIHHKHPAHPEKRKQLYGVIGWRALTLDFLADHYNVGDGNYPRKLQFALDMITKAAK